MARFQGDVPERSFSFALMVLELVRDIPNGTIGWTVGKQLSRCGTSVGANIAEADGALTDAEFASICNIARREAGETLYWLRLCREADLLTPELVAPAAQEAKEIHDILASIVRKTQLHSKRRAT